MGAFRQPAQDVLGAKDGKDTNDLIFRFSVATISRPPGATAWLQAVMKALRSSTCSTTSIFSTTSKRRPCDDLNAALEILDVEVALLSVLAGDQNVPS